MEEEVGSMSGDVDGRSCAVLIITVQNVMSRITLLGEIPYNYSFLVMCRSRRCSSAQRTRCLTLIIP